jgi:hypothetical protein
MLSVSVQIPLHTVKTSKVMTKSPMQETRVNADIDTYASIMQWGANNKTQWYHPVGSLQYQNYNVGCRYTFICKGDPIKNTTVEVIAKGNNKVYESMKTMHGAFTANFPWGANTHLVLVRVVST